MTNRFKRLRYLVFIFLVFSCGNKITLEDQVLEFIFNEKIQSATKQIFISKNYEYGVLEEHTLTSLLEAFEEIRNYPEDLVEELVNSSNSEKKITWKPIMVNAYFFDQNHVYDNNHEKASDIVRSDHHVGRSMSYHTVSRVALNKETSEAVVLVGFRCATLCGANDTLVYVRKYGTEWKVEYAVRLWVS